MLKFTAEVAYTLPSNFNINSGEVGLDQLDLELEPSADLRLKVIKAYIRLDEKLKKLFVIFESEGFMPEPLEVDQEKVNDLERRLPEIFRDIGEYLALLLQLEYSLPLVLADVKISPIQIIDDKHKNIIIAVVNSLPITLVSVVLTSEKLFEPNNLRDAIKNAIDLVKLSEKQEMINLLKRIIKWYYLALNEFDETDRFIDYLMILEIWKLYKAYKDNDEKCIPIPKPRSSHKECLSKAIKDLCSKDVFSNWDKEFNDFYEGRNKVIHEGLLEEASKHLKVASECVEKIIEELRKEIQIFLQHNK